MPVDLLGYAYAATVAAGGIVGYIKAASIPSLAAGLTFGLVLGYGAHLTSQDPPRPLLQLGTAAVLGGMMAGRYYRSGKIMPAGLIAVLSLAAFVRNIYQFNRHLPLPGRQ